jgi:CRP-like cAMP-binding protein
MHTDDLSILLRNHSFLEGLKPDYLDLILSCSSNVFYPTGSKIFSEGEEAKKFYLIRTGKAAIEIDGREKGSIRILTLGAGQILGWSWLVSPYKWHFDAYASEDLRAVALDGECLRKKCEENHDLGYELLKRFSGILEARLKATRIQLLDVYKKESK